jgi:uncharacterized OB-fold protein
MKRGPSPSSVESRGAGDVDIGLAVRAVFRPRRQRKGSILDIRYFRPVAS